MPAHATPHYRLSYLIIKTPRRRVSARKCGTTVNNDSVALGSGIQIFSSVPGCTQPMGDSSPLHFFQLLVTDEMLDGVVGQIQLYVTQYIDAHTINPRSHIQQWSRQQFNRDELKKFMALIIIMGLVNLPLMEDHWVTSWPYSSHTCSRVKN